MNITLQLIFITVEDYALIAMNHFENFFIYLSFYKKDYLQGDETVFDKAITDFLRITRKNFKIIVLEKAVAHIFWLLKTIKILFILIWKNLFLKIEIRLCDKLLVQ